MYDLGDVLDDATVDPGTNVLVSGPPLTGKRRVALRVLASGTAKGEGAIIVTTKDNAERTLDEYESVAGGLDDAPVGIVDCVSKQQGADENEDDPRIRYASSPVDLTGIGIQLSEFLEEFSVNRGIEGNRILLHSVSPLLMYSDLQTVFRFLHVFTGRVQSAGALGLYVIDATAHDEKTMNTLKQLFDGVIDVEQDDESEEPTVTTRGIATSASN